MLPHLQARYLPPSEIAADPVEPEPAKPVFPDDPPREPQSKVDPDRMPRPLGRYDYQSDSYRPDIDKKPPHIYASYEVLPGCVASPRHLRFATHHIGYDSETQTTTELPIACVWQPFADLPLAENVPVLDSDAIPRCKECMTYANPFFEILAAGHMFKCNMCGTTQYASERAISRHGSFLEREVGTYDIPLAVEFDSCDPASEVFAVCVDVSLVAANCGLYQTVFATVRDALEFLPHPEATSFVFLTFDTSLHIYVNSDTVSQCIVPDTGDLFAPVPFSQMEFRADDEELVRKLNFLAEAPRAELTSTALSVGAVVTALTEVLRPGSRIMVFSCNIGSEGVLGLKPRDNARLHNQEQEASLLAPQLQFGELAGALVAKGICVDLFACTTMYVDVASLASLVSPTGGDIYYYPHYSQAADHDKVCYQLIRSLTRPQALNILAKVRCSNALNLDQVIGHYHRKSPTEFQVPIVDCDKALTLLFSHDSRSYPYRMKNGSLQFVQLACLYTHSVTQKRYIRVFNSALRATLSYGKRKLQRKS